MAIGRVVELTSAPTVGDSPRSNKKRQRQQTNQTVSDARSNQASNAQSNQASKRRRRKRPHASAPPPCPAEVIDVDADHQDLPASKPASNRESKPASKPASNQESNPTSKSASNPTMAQLDSDDYFEVLGLPRSCSDADVKKAYRKLAVQWHPDKNRENPQAEEYFKRIAEAYETLSDPEKRQHYERFGKGSIPASKPASNSSRHARDIFEAFFGGADPFEAFFGRRGAPRGFPDDDDDFGFPSAFGGGIGRRSGGLGGFGMMDSFFSEGFGAGGGFGGFSGGAGFSSQSVSSSTYTDRNGHVVTTKTTTTTTPDGRTETVTEEFRNGKLTSSTAAGSSSRLAGAGRMQLEGSGRGSRRRQ